MRSEYKLFVPQNLTNSTNTYKFSAKARTIVRSERTSTFHNHIITITLAAASFVYLDWQVLEIATILHVSTDSTRP